MGCCFRNKNEDPNDSIKITEKIKNDYLMPITMEITMMKKIILRIQMR